jgi:hypothetical protein
MTRYFAFFHFNHALHAGLDFEAAREAEGKLFERWRDLPAPEVAALRRRSAKGLRTAYLLAALAALRKADDERADRFLDSAGAGRRRMWTHPLAWLVLMAKALGPRTSEHLRSRWRSLVKAYRDKRYLYRYG